MVISYDSLEKRVHLARMCSELLFMYVIGQDFTEQYATCKEVLGCKVG